MLTCIGVDPGIANTGVACVYNDGSRYHLLESVWMRTKASESGGSRLSRIEAAFAGVLTNYPVDCIAIERVSHNRNDTFGQFTEKRGGWGAVLGARTPKI